MSVDKNNEWYKKQVDEVFSKAIWEPEEKSMYEFYDMINFNGHFEFSHKGFSYFITFDKDSEKNDVWLIYERDFSNPKIAYKTDWDIEPKTPYKSLEELIFGFRLKNDGRTITEYVCECLRVPRILIPDAIKWRENDNTK
ncbi:MAG: hypothetical protein UHW86_08905 [Spirochaetota bacterium]|nr:hypothetical protein [Spirochaetota bacterium]